MALTPEQAAEAQAAIDRGEAAWKVASRYGYHSSDVGLTAFERDIQARTGELPLPEGPRYTPSEEIVESYKPAPVPIPLIEKLPPVEPITEVTMPTKQDVPPAVLEWAGLIYAWQRTPEAIAEAGRRWKEYQRRGVETRFVQTYEPARVVETGEAYSLAKQRFEAAAHKAFGSDWSKIIEGLSKELPKELAVEPGTMLTPEAYKAWEKAFIEHYGIAPETLKERWPRIEGSLKALSGTTEAYGLEVSRFESFQAITKKIAVWEYEHSFAKAMDISIPDPFHELRKAIFGKESPQVKAHEAMQREITGLEPGRVYPVRTLVGAGELALWYGAFAAIGYAGGLVTRAVGSTAAKGVKAITITPLTKLAPRVSPAVASRWTSLAPGASAWALRHPTAIKTAAYGIPYGIYGGLETWKVKTMYEAEIATHDIMWQVSKDVSMVAGFGRGFTWGLKTDLPAKLRAIGKQRIAPEDIFSPRTLAGEQQIPLGKYKTVDQLVAEFKAGKYGLEALPDEQMLMLKPTIRRELELLTRTFRKHLRTSALPSFDVLPPSAGVKMGAYGQLQFSVYKQLRVPGKGWWGIAFRPKLKITTLGGLKETLDTTAHEWAEWSVRMGRSGSRVYPLELIPEHKIIQKFSEYWAGIRWPEFKQSLERYWVWHTTDYPFKKVTTVMPGFRAEKVLFVAPEPSTHFFRFPAEDVAPYTKALGWGVPGRPTALYIGVTDILQLGAAQKAGAAYITRKATFGIRQAAWIEKEAGIPTGTVLEKIAGKEYSVLQGRVFNIDRYLAWGGDATKLATQRGAKSVEQVLSYYEREMGRALITSAGYSYAIAGLVSSLRPPAPTYYQPKPYYQPARAYPTPPVYKAPSVPSYKPAPPYKPYQLPYPPDVYKPPPPPYIPPYIYEPPRPPYIPPPPVYRPMPMGLEFPKPPARPKVKAARFRPLERVWPVGRIEKLFEVRKVKAKKAKDAFDARGLEEAFKLPKTGRRG